VHTALRDAREATIYKNYRKCHISYTINEKKGIYAWICREKIL